MWDLTAGRERANLPCNSGAGTVVISPDGAILATGEWDGRVNLWNVAKRVLLDTYYVSKDLISDAAFSPNGRSLIPEDNREAALALKEFVPPLHTQRQLEESGFINPVVTD